MYRISKDSLNFYLRLILPVPYVRNFYRQELFRSSSLIFVVHSISSRELPFLIFYVSFAEMLLTKADISNPNAVLIF